MSIVWLPSTRELYFDHCLVGVRLLHCLRVRLRNGNEGTYAHAQYSGRAR